MPMAMKNVEVQEKNPNGKPVEIQCDLLSDRQTAVQGAFEFTFYKI